MCGQLPHIYNVQRRVIEKINFFNVLRKRAVQSTLTAILFAVFVYD